VKICGITSVEDADGVLHAGADAIGINLIPSSKRYVDLPLAKAIAERVRGKLLTVAVVADPSVETAAQLHRELGVDYLQLHGNETPELVSQLTVPVFKAVRIGTAEDVALARRYPGELLLADAKVEGALGGTGASFDWSLAADLAGERKLIVAGGIRPDNVAQAIRALHPWGVDVASGAEEAGNPRKKSAARVAELLAAVRSATE
jgi:phosphoribosylanthranilate isomerase